MKVEIYDTECFPNFWSYTGINKDTKEIYAFYLYNNIGNLQEFRNYMKSVKGGISFNGNSYDYPILHSILLGKINTNEEIYDLSKRIVNNERLWIKDKEIIIPQLDLFKLHHFHNRARATSLKDLEVAMNWINVQDLPFKYDYIVKQEDIESIMLYNLNDVLATEQFYLKSLDKIELRKSLIKEFGINCINTSDVGIGEQLFLYFLSKDMNIDPWELRQMRTERSEVILKDIILDYIKFDHPEFRSLLDKFKQTVVRNTKNDFGVSLIMEGMKLEYGLGGLHYSIDPGIYTEDDEYQILDIDVSSFYPNIAINNNLRPEHLGESFSRRYKYVYDERTKIPKSDPKNGAYKLMLNGSFGKANDDYSFLKDIKFLLGITVNGQLLLSMLVDQLIKIKDLTILQCNTDGVSVKFKRSDLYIIKRICKDWELTTNLQLEYAEYSKMVINNVNNYLAITTNNKVKYKGLFEVDKEWHKDHSFRIIPYALSQYFVHNVSIQDTIYNHSNIYDFCGRNKSNKDCYSEIRYWELNPNNKNAEVVTEKQQKTTRYYISNSSNSFYRVYHSGKSAGSEEAIDKGYSVTVFNQFVQKDIKDYKINYQYYITQCNKIINIVESKQLKLF